MPDHRGDAENAEVAQSNSNWGCQNGGSRKRS